MTPQVATFPGETQVLSGSQQPPSQLDALQRHWPAWHVWPVMHPASPPQVHEPSWQPSPSSPQEKQAVPEMPHEVLASAMQVLPWQQPPSQLDALQPLQVPLQVWSPTQVAQVMPLAPQAVVAVPTWQVLLWQQPVWQEVESQTHCALWHSSPAVHIAPPPQLQTPASEQLSDLASQT